MKGYFQTLNILFFGLVMGPALLGAFTVILIETGSWVPAADESLDLMFGTMVPAVGLACFFASKKLFESRLASLAMIQSLDERLDVYRSALMVRYALLESPSIFAFIAFMLTGTFLFLGIGAAMLAVMLTARPTRDGVVIHLALSGEEALAVRGE